MMATMTLFLLIVIGIVAVTFFVINYLAERHIMKQKLLKRRDAMVDDLLARVLRDQNNLNDSALRARRELIRASQNVRKTQPRSREGISNPFKI
jgi:hypothetical protein